MNVSRAAAVAVSLAAVAACSSATTRPGAPEPGLSPAEAEAIYRARQDSLRLRFSPADVRFMTDMIHHHAQAVIMARLAPSNGASESIRTLAARIINSQLDEIALMQTWLRDRGQPVPELHVTDTQVMVHGGDQRDMPGMLTNEQLRLLQDARGPAFDRLFLTLMIEHHSGAVEMVRRLLATDGAVQDDAVFRFVSDVQVDQTTEIARMQRMLDALPGRAPTP